MPQHLYAIPNSKTIFACYTQIVIYLFASFTEDSVRGLEPIYLCTQTVRQYLYVFQTRYERQFQIVTQHLHAITNNRQIHERNSTEDDKTCNGSILETTGQTCMQ